MKLSKQKLTHALIFAHDKTGNTVFKNAQNALKNGTLEIEGYERSEWIKFDPNDPKTFPPKFERVLYSCDGDIRCGTRQFIEMSIWRGAGNIYWRPLPKPPQETEAGK